MERCVLENECDNFGAWLLQVYQNLLQKTVDTPIGTFSPTFHSQLTDASDNPAHTALLPS